MRLLATTALVCLALLIMPLRSASAQAAELQRITDEIAAIGVELGNLTRQYERPEVTGPARRFSQRVTDGEILFLLGDYTRASLVLYDIVNDRRSANEPLYGKALYYLAESLFQIKHDLSAREHFQELVRRRNPRHLRKSIRRLIEIADRNHRWEGLEAHVSVLREHGGLPAGVAYINAKSLLRQGKPQAALEAARAIPQDHALGPKGAYLAAVAQTQLGDLESAHKAFSALTKIDDTFADAQRIRELAAMNRARIFLEQGKISESVDAYQYVGRSSPLFEEALFEVTWTYVRSADLADDDETRATEFKKARRALEILLLSEAETPLAPEAKLLLGNIQLRLDEFDVATETFDNVVDRYGPVRDALHDTAAQEIDPERFFEEVSGRASGQTGILPPLAVKWATGQGRLQEAINVVSDLDTSEKSLSEADQIIDKLLDVLNSDRRASFFPALQDAQTQVMAHGNSLVALSQRMLVVERGLVEDKLDEVSAAQLERVLAERQRLRSAYEKLPKKKEDYVGRLASMRQRMQGLQQQAYRLKYTVSSIRAQLNALQLWISQNRDYINDEARKEYRQRIAQEARVVVELEGLQATLETEIGREKSRISITSEAEEREQEVKALYEATLEREREILDTAGTLPAVAARMMTSIEKQRAVVAAYRAELQKFQRHIDDAVAEKSLGLKAEVLKERGVLESYGASISATRGDAKRVIGQIARASFGDVRRRFGDIVLRADVGIVDVAWALKEAQTHAISRRVNEQRRELKVLDHEFAEVLADE